MKIAYIILPFESSEYLIRCMNSIHRQTVGGDKYCIVLAENEFGENSEKIEEHLSAMSGLIRISGHAESNEAKVKEAMNLIPEDADYVLFTEADTVFSPVAGSEFEKYEGKDFIIAGEAVKENENFKRNLADLSDFIRLNSKIGITDVLMRKHVLKEAEDVIFTSNAYFQLFVINAAFCNSMNIAMCEQICMYVANRTQAPSCPEYAEYFDFAETIIKNCVSNSSSNWSLEIYDSMMNLFIGCINDEAASDIRKVKAFAVIKKISTLIEKNTEFSRLNELKLGCNAECLEGMDYDGFVVYRKIYNRCYLEAVNDAVSDAIYRGMKEYEIRFNRVEEEFNSLNSNVKKEIDSVNQLVITEKKESENIKDEIEKLRNDIATLNKNIHFLSQSVAEIQNTNKVFTNDPVYAIPHVFDMGRAGFSVILKSIRAWFRFKFSRKSSK